MLPHQDWCRGEWQGKEELTEFKGRAKSWRASGRPDMGWDVLISYSSENDSVTDRIEAHLVQAGLQCYRDKIRRRSQDPLETAFVVTDSALMSDPRFHACPWVSIGGPETNGWTRRFAEQFPAGVVGPDTVRVQERLSHGDKRVLLWGHGREETGVAGEHFVNSGGLERYLNLVWQRG